MKAGKTREGFEEQLIQPILTIKRKRNVPQVIKENLLSKNKIIGGNVQSLLNNPKVELPKVDWRVLLLFAEQVYLAVREELIDPELINPRNYYTDVEISRARQYTGKMMVEGDISLPLVLENVLMIAEDKYATIIPAKTLAEMSALLLNYNFNIQRESNRKMVGGETIQEATLVMENVLEMKEHLKKNTLETTNIVINASAGTSDTGNELHYDPQAMTLTVNKGTVLDIVDGYHRCKASELAVNENPDIDFKFMALILNYTDDQAMKYQGQLAKATPIAKPRMRQLAESRHADTIVKRLNTQSELRGKIAISSKPSLRNGELVAYDVLADTIDQEFDLDRMVDVHMVGEYLTNFFDILLGYYEEQFLKNPIEHRKSTLLVENNMFIGYVVLAKRMYESKIEVNKVIEYISRIDFNKDNELWRDLDILDSEGNLTSTHIVRKAISDYFKMIPI